MKRKVYFILPNKTTVDISIEDGKSNYRSIVNQLTHFHPEELILIIDNESDRVISKYQDKLKDNNTYKLIQADTLYKDFVQTSRDILQEKQKKEQIQKELNKEQQDREINRREKLALEKQITDLEDKIKMLNATGQKEIQQQQQETQKKMDDLKKQLLSLQKDNELAKDYQNQLIKDQKAIQNQLQEQIDKKNNELAQINSQNQQFQQQILNLKSENDQLKLQINQCQSYFSNLYNQVNTSNQQLQFKLQQNETDFETKMEEQNRIIKNLNIEIADKKKKQKNFEEEIEQLKDYVKKQKNQIETIQNTNEREQKKLKNEIDEREDELGKQNIKIQNLNQDLQKKERLMEKLKLEMQQQQQQYIQDRQQPQINPLQIEIVGKQLQDAKRQNNELNAELDDLRNRYNDLEQEKLRTQGQINILKDEKNGLQSKIDQLKQQIELIEKEKISTIKIQKDNFSEQEQRFNNQIEELNRKNQTDQQNWRNQKQGLDQEIERLNGEIQKLLNEKFALESEATQTRKAFQEQILDFDSKMVAKDNELRALQNASQVAMYDLRIRRLVESVPREYAQDIEFSIETMMRERAKCDDFQKKYQDQTKKVTLQIVKVTLNKKIADETLYNVSDQNFQKLIQMGAEAMTITGTQSFNAYESSDTALERIYFFKCTNCPKMKELEGKIFGIKECKKGDIAELGSQETAQSNCLATLIAQDMLNTFIQDLKAKNYEKVPKDLKFQNQYIIITEKHFKQVFQEEFQRQQLVNPLPGFKFIMELIKHLNDELSNDLYSDIRQFQLDKQRNNKKVIGADGAQVLKTFIENLDIAQKPNILAEYNKLDRNTLNKGFDNFIDFLGGIDKDMPQKTYYAMQQIDIVDGFKKYNGGHMKFEVDELGKFFSAFSYYSIIKSKRQICVSHIQGAKNILYDPLVSTYDGFLDKLDQGYNEIRTFESKFLSEQNINKGVEYLKILGINWK